jgi:hypothetical protein
VIGGSSDVLLVAVATVENDDIDADVAKGGLGGASGGMTNELLEAGNGGGIDDVGDDGDVVVDEDEGSVSVVVVAVEP